MTFACRLGRKNLCLYLIVEVQVTFCILAIFYTDCDNCVVFNLQSSKPCYQPAACEVRS